MLKRKFMSMLLVLLCIVGICGCSLSNAERKVAGKKFVYTHGDKTDNFVQYYCLLIEKDGTFSHTPGALSSHGYHGEWNVDGDYVILTTDDNKNYVLKIADRALIFDESRSDGNFSVSDGTVFKRSGLFG